jgi:hypothetical protein
MRPTTSRTIWNGWANRDLDIGAFSSPDWIGSRVDGWANRDEDIGAF